MEKGVRGKEEGVRSSKALLLEKEGMEYIMVPYLDKKNVEKEQDFDPKQSQVAEVNTCLETERATIKKWNKTAQLLSNLSPLASQSASLSFGSIIHKCV